MSSQNAKTKTSSAETERLIKEERRSRAKPWIKMKSSTSRDKKAGSTEFKPRSKNQFDSFNPGLIATPSVVSSTISSSNDCKNLIFQSNLDIRQTLAHSRDVADALEKIKSDIINCGNQYGRCTPPSLRGRITEKFVAGSYNLDATIKKNSSHAICPDSRAPGSADIIVTDSRGQKYQISCKSYGTPRKSVNAQLDPRLDGQLKLIPADQVVEGRAYGIKRANQELHRGRPDAAGRHAKNADKIIGKISIDGVESTPLTKAQGDKLSKSFKVDENDTVRVDAKKINRVLDETGDSAKVSKTIARNQKRIQSQKIKITQAKHARIRSEIKGAVSATGIAAFTSGGITATVTLIEDGLSVKNVQAAAIKGAKSGAEGGLVAAGTYGITRTVGGKLLDKATTALSNAGVKITSNVSAATNSTLFGALTTAVNSGFVFAKMKADGASTKEALAAAAQNAKFSLGTTVLTSVATLAFGATAGTAVSATVGLGMLGNTFLKAFRKRRNDSAYC